MTDEVRDELLLRLAAKVDELADDVAAVREERTCGLMIDGEVA